MWVLGDLKDRLGIKHRNDKSSKRTGEATPMIEMDYHDLNASFSEGSSIDLQYEPPHSRAAQSSLAHPNVAQPIYVVQDEWDTETPIVRQPPPGSALSYYSASDIPPPSPFPERHIYSPRASQKANMSSVNNSPVAVNYGGSSRPSSYAPPSPRQTPPRSPHAREYELDVRGPLQGTDFERSHSRVSHVTEATETSFVTAREGSMDHGGEEQRSMYDDDAATIRANQEAGHDPWRESTYSYHSG